MHDKLLNIKEVADYLNLPEDMIKDLVAKGELPAYKVGGLLLRFKKEQIEQYRKKSTPGNAGENATAADRTENRFAHLTGDREAGGGRRILKRQGEGVSYSPLERLEDFLYYNDFYLLSLILLVLVVFAILEL